MDIKCTGKGCLNLPQKASAETLYLSYKRGGLNFLPINVLANITQIVHRLGLLQSEHLGQLSMAFLESAVQKHITRHPALDLPNDLCGSMEGGFENESIYVPNI